MEKEKSEHRGNVRKLISSLISMFICLVLLFCIAFAWFGQAHDVGGSGNSAKVIDTYSLKVASAKDGADLSTFSAPDNLFSVTFNNDVSEIYPGCAGSFDMYLTILNDSQSAGGNIILTPEIISGGYDNSGILQTGFREGYDAQSAASAVDYLQGHILLFKNLSADGIYSGWVDPYGGTEISFRNNECVTLYWVWVDYYYKFYTANALIAEADIAKIGNYFFSAGNPVSPTDNAFVYMLDHRNAAAEEFTLTRLGHYYDFADELIGRMIYNFSFRIGFSGLS